MRLSMRIASVTAFGLVGCGQINHGSALVQDEAGTPIPAAKVQFWYGERSEPARTGFTDADGRYDFGLEGAYGSSQAGTLVAVKEGFDEAAIRYIAMRSADTVTIVLPHSAGEPR